MDPNAQVPQPGQQPQPMPQQPAQPQPAQQPVPAVPQPAQQPGNTGQSIYPQQPVQPSAGQPMMTPPSSGGSKKNFVLIGIIAGVLLLGIVGFLLTRGAGSSPQEKAVLDFVKAAQSKDCEGIIGAMSDELVVGGDRTALISNCEENIDTAAPFQDLEGIKVVSTALKDSTDDTAKVVLKSSRDGETASEEVSLVLEDGNWRISNID